MWYKSCLFIFLSFLLTQNSFATPIDWQKLARLDLASAKYYLQNDSAGGADRENLGFQQWLTQGYQQALVKAVQVDSANSYILIMNFYLNGFHDEHIVYNHYLARYDVPLLWPGFTVYYKNHAFYVSALAYEAQRTNMPPKNSRLISCDGFTPEQLMANRVFPYFGNATLEASWHLDAPRLFFYPKNPWFSPLKACIFELDQRKKTVTLHWQSINLTRAVNLRNLASYRYHGHTGATIFFNEQAVWVSLPSFMPNKKTERTALNDVLDAAPTWRHKKLIIFDTRGNRGGDSLWGSQLLSALYGAHYFHQQTWSLNNPIYQWRVCTGNVSELKHFYLPMVEKDTGDHSASYIDLEVLTHHLMHAEKQHADYYPSNVGPEPVQQAPTTRFHNLVHAKILWLTDGRCASACLTFGDQLMQFPHVTQIGQTTHADTDYTELRIVVLPSSAHLYFPMKVQRCRSRKINEPYKPTLGNNFEGDINDTIEVRRWVVGRFF